MFELTSTEYEILRSQFGTLKQGGHSKYLPMAFTEQGVAMLSSVLNSPPAIKVNIQIIRVFTKIREVLTETLTVKLEIEHIKKKLINHDKNIELVFSYLDEMMEKQENKVERNKIGYKKKFRNENKINTEYPSPDRNGILLFWGSEQKIE